MVRVGDSVVVEAGDVVVDVADSQSAALFTSKMRAQSPQNNSAGILRTIILYFVSLTLRLDCAHDFTGPPSSATVSRHVIISLSPPPAGKP